MEQTAEVFKGLRPHILHGTKKYDKNHHILISTLQTAYRRDISPDVIIIDEIHYGYSGKMIKELINDRKDIQIIGLSATPYDGSGNLLEGFDKILNKYDMKYMIQNRFLVPIRSFILTRPDLRGVDIIAGDYDLKQLGKVVCDNNTILEIVSSTKEFIEKSNKTIVFAVDINHAELLSKAFRHDGFTSSALHSKLKKDEVKYEIERFKKGHTKVLVSVLMLTTGFDVPETDVAIIARPTRSQNLYKQMVGRIARLAKDKKYGVLLDCGNVIENLGKPLDPIKPIIGNQIENKLKCLECESEDLKLVKNKDGLFWECNDCGFIKEIINKNFYECEYCNEEYSYEANFELVNNKLYLNCHCGYETLISEFTGSEIFIEIENKNEEFIFLPFEEARIFARNLNYPSKTTWDYHISHKEDLYYPDNIPFDPENYYKNEGWTSWDNWLGIIRKNQKVYYTFADARDFIHNLKLKSIKEWEEYIKNSLPRYKNIPNYIPKNPEKKYSNKWKGLNDWLGLRDEDKELNNESDNIGFLSFEEARSFAINLNIRSKKPWQKYCINELEGYPKKPNNIPENPDEIYLNNGWISWNHWFDKSKEYISYEESKKYVKTLGIKSKREWQKHLQTNKIPKDVPTDPLSAYNNKGWINYNNWLDIENKDEEKKKQRNSSYNVEFLPFEEARNFVRKLGIKTTKEWQNYCINELTNYTKKPENIPRSPEQTYRREGWINYKDWLNERQMNFIDAKNFVKKLKLTTKDEWLKYCRSEYLYLPTKPNNIPRDPVLRYRKEWKNWEDWLTGSTNRVYGQWRDFNEARNFIRELGLENTLDWKKYCKGKLEDYGNKPHDIPSSPDEVYKDEGWINYADWLNTENIRKSTRTDVWLPYEDAKKFIHFLGLKNYDEWILYINNEITHLPSKPTNIPKTPSYVYKNEGWKNWNDWIGINIIDVQERVKEKNEYYSFEEARSYVHSLKLNSIDEWKYYIEGLMPELEDVPYFLPLNPKEAYKKKGWWGLNDWIGLNK